MSYAAANAVIDALSQIIEDENLRDKDAHKKNTKTRIIQLITEVAPDVNPTEKDAVYKEIDCEGFDLTLQDFNDTFKSGIARQKILDTFGGRWPQTYEEMIEFFCEENGVMFRIGGKLKTDNGIEDARDVMDQLTLISGNLNIFKSTHTRDAALNIKIRNDYTAYYNKIIQDIKFDESIVQQADTEWKRFISAMLGPNENDLHICEIILKHFIWQVKRKMNKQKVTYHIMPVFAWE